MFMGEFQHNVDAKGRLIIPSKFRKQLGVSFVITRGMDKCLYGYPMNDWEEFTEKAKKLPLSKAEARAFTHHFFSQADESELDKQGRINIPAPLREFANLTKNCVIVGVLNRIEIWDQEAWNAYNATSEENFEQIAQTMEDFGF